MTLAICALFGEHSMRVVDAARMRLQETDRIKAMVTELQRVGTKAEEHEDGFTVWPAEPGQLHGVTPVGLAPVTRLFGHEGERDHPADIVFCGQITREPRPTRAGVRDKAQVCGLRLPLPHQGVDVPWPRAKGSQRDDLSLMILSNVSNRDRLLMNIHADVKRARLVHG